MPYRELTMIDIKEVLRRWSARQSLHRIARETGVDRKTIRRYVHAATSCSLPQGREPTEDEIHEVAQRVQARPLPDPSAEWQAVAAHRERIEAWLTKKRPLRLTKVHTLLVREHGLEASYDTLRRFASQQLAWRQKAPTVRVDDPPPGQEAQVDFGKMGPMLDPVAGRVRMLWALIVTLSFSRYQFVWPTFVQTTETVCEGLDRAWTFFAAMIRTVVPDYVARHVIVVLCPTRLRGRVRELCELNARSSRTQPHIRLECVEPGEQALVGPPDGLSREWRRSCSWRLARLQRRLLRAHVDLGVAVGRVQADVAEPTADHVDLYAGLEQVYGRRVTEYVRTDSAETGFEVPRVTTHEFVDAEARQRATMTRREDGSIRWARGGAQQRFDLPDGFGPEWARSPLVALAVKACARGGSEVEIANAQVDCFLHARPRVVEEQDERPISGGVASG